MLIIIFCFEDEYIVRCVENFVDIVSIFTESTLVLHTVLGNSVVTVLCEHTTGILVLLLGGGRR